MSRETWNTGRDILDQSLRCTYEAFTMSVVPQSLAGALMHGVNAKQRADLESLTVEQLAARIEREVLDDDVLAEVHGRIIGTVAKYLNAGMTPLSVPSLAYEAARRIVHYRTCGAGDCTCEQEDT